MAYQFGAAVTIPGSLGLLQSYSLTETCERGYARDENGHVAAAQTFNRKEEMTAEVLFDVAQSRPSTGASMTVDGDIFTITSSGYTENNQDYTMISISGERFINNTIPAS